MGLETSVNILVMVGLVLIAVISSKKAKRLVGRGIDFSINLIKGVISILAILAVVLIVGGVISSIPWGWKKLHEIFPEMWSLKELLAVVGIFAGYFFILFLREQYKLDEKIQAWEHRWQKNKFNSLVDDIGQGLFVLLFNTVIAGYGWEVNKTFGLIIFVVGLPAYFLVRNLVWRRVLKNLKISTKR